MGVTKALQIKRWLAIAQQSLADSGIASARLDGLILLEDATSRDRAWLLAHDDEALTSVQLDQLADWLERRLQHEPMAYIRGFQEFYGRRFMVTPDVLVPRPESESMIELVKTVTDKNGQNNRIADIGTGSGCLAITTALETGAQICAVDVDEACLAVTERNAVVHTASMRLAHGSLVLPFVPGGVAADFAPTILLANLPYVPTNYPINQAARHEPALALFGGADGLDVYRTLFEQLWGLPTPPRHVITESLLSQHEDLTALAATAGYGLVTVDGLAQLFSIS